MKIDVSEVRVQKELLVISVNSIKEQLSVSRSRLSEVVSTDSLKGTVKDAINQKVTNYQIPLVDNYVNALDSIVSRYDGLVKLFQDTVSETDNSAIIKTEYLERIKQRMKDPIEGLKSSSSKTKNIYAGISDILTLTNPSLDSVNTSYNQAVKSLDDTIKNMEAFNSVLLKTDTFDLIDMQNSEIATLSGYASLPYGDCVSRNYYKRQLNQNSTSFINVCILIFQQEHLEHALLIKIWSKERQIIMRHFWKRMKLICSLEGISIELNFLENKSMKRYMSFFVYLFSIY